LALIILESIQRALINKFQLLKNNGINRIITVNMVIHQ
jgi:hypothetical protein